MIVEDYQFKRTPKDHQLEKFLKFRDTPNWGHLWEMGTGKTKEDIDQTAWLFQQGIINGWIILAPNGVHSNWITDEIVNDLPDSVMSQTLAFAYHSSKAGTVDHMEMCERLLRHDGFSIVAMSYDAAITARKKLGRRVGDSRDRYWMGGRSFITKFLGCRDAKMTLDESSRIKSAGAKRTRAIVSLGKNAVVRRIYTGTPVPNGPLDIYPQIKFLDPDFWVRHGLGSYEAFKTTFGIWRAEVNSKTGNRFEYCVGYKNLDRLYGILSEITDRITKEEVMDLPEKVYTPCRFDLSSQQRKLYDKLSEECIAWLDDDSDIAITAETSIVKLLRLQQIASGWVPISEEDALMGNLEPIHEIPGPNPRLLMLRELVEDMPHPSIVWARFRRDVDLICELLDSMGKTYVRYDGAVPPGPERDEAKRRFNDGEVQFFVSNPAVGGQGLTLIRAKTTIYYSNSFDLDQRLQSEDRNHRIGQDVSVNYIDLMARDTVDSRIIESLRDKIDIAAQITGDRLREWL